MEELSEEKEARDPDGVCQICLVGLGEAHVASAHDSFWRAEEATWD